MRRSSNFRVDGVRRNSRDVPSFFRKARTSTCGRIVAKNGKYYAVPFKVSKSCLKFKQLENFKPEEVREVFTSYQRDYCRRPQSAGGRCEQLKKLVKYDPEAERNKLICDEPEIPFQAMLTSIRIGQNNLTERNWRTEYRTKIGNFGRRTYCTNPSIISRLNATLRSRQSK